MTEALGMIEYGGTTWEVSEFVGHHDGVTVKIRPNEVGDKERAFRDAVLDLLWAVEDGMADAKIMDKTQAVSDLLDGMT